MLFARILFELTPSTVQFTISCQVFITLINTPSCPSWNVERINPGGFLIKHDMIKVVVYFFKGVIFGLQAASFASFCLYAYSEACNLLQKRSIPRLLASKLWKLCLKFGLIELAPSLTIAKLYKVLSIWSEHT